MMTNQPEDRLPMLCGVIEAIESKHEPTAREWSDLIVYIFSSKVLRKRGSDTKTVHALDSLSRVQMEVAKVVRGIHLGEGQANTPTK